MSAHAISPEGLALIQQFEGFHAEPAPLPDGAWVVGHGHVRIGAPGHAVARAEARSLLALDLAPAERSVNAAVTLPITQQQFDALVSFAFSVGVEAFEKSDVLRKLNAGHVIAAGCAMDAWRKADVGGELEVVDTLVRRRAAEKALLLADAPVQAAPSVFMRARLDHAASILGAPIAFASAPQLDAAQAPAPKAKIEPAQRITEILQAEPQTAALLLTQVVAEDAAAVEEIVTAHAKPVARRIVAPALPRFHAPRLRLSFTATAESIGLLSLLAFGLGLIALGCVTYFGGRADAVDMLGASALAMPGLAATGAAAYGLWKTPALHVARAV